MSSSQRNEYASALRLLEEHTMNAAAVQHRLLCDILAHNSHTEYLCKLFPTSCSPPALADAPAAIDPHSFKLFAPLSSYEDLLPFIDRIASGDKSPILTACPVTVLFRSSGTSSGKGKIFPATESDTERDKLFFTYTSLVESEIKSHLQGLDYGKQMNFIFIMPDEWTASGMLMRPRTTSFYKNPHVRQHLEEVNASPMEAVLECEDASQSAYTQLLCGLIRRKEVVCVGAIFASSLLYALHIFQQRWCELVEDIRSGCLSKSAVTDLSVRKAVEALIHGPDPVLASQVEAECSREPLWKGIVPRLWPQAKYVSCATSGSMEQYISKLEFFAGDLPLISTLYAGSEGGYGINMSPLCSPYEVSYTILPDMAYFEFLPLDATDNALNDHSCLVDLVNVELGKVYEMVLTTYAGLYRFRVGDVVQVTGFYNKTPQLHLVGRKNVVLSVDTDKTDEVTLERAVQVARVGYLEATGGLLVDYTSYTDASTFPGHYVLFWEITICNSSGHVLEGPSLHGQISSANVLEECCSAMEKCFDDEYKYLREHNKIGPLEIRVVKEGSFHDLMNYSVARGVSISQYKTPRAIKLAPVVEFLNSKVSHSFKAHT